MNKCQRTTASGIPRQYCQVRFFRCLRFLIALPVELRGSYIHYLTDHEWTGAMMRDQTISLVIKLGRAKRDSIHARKKLSADEIAKIKSRVEKEEKSKIEVELRQTIIMEVADELQQKVDMIEKLQMQLEELQNSQRKGKGKKK